MFSAESAYGGGYVLEADEVKDRGERIVERQRPSSARYFSDPLGAHVCT